MKANFRKIVFLVLHGLLVLALALPAILLILRYIIPSLFTSTPRTIHSALYFVPPLLIHLLLSYLGMLPAIFLPRTSRNSIERSLLPPLYMTITLTDIPVVITYLYLSGQSSISFSFIGRIYLFAVLLSTMFLLYMGLFHFGINTGRLLQYILITIAGCLLVSMLVPLSVALDPLHPKNWFADKQFYWLPLFLGVLSAFNYIVLFLRENTQHNLFRYLSLLLILVGNFVYIARFNVIASWIGVVLYASGVLISVPRGRFSRLL
ncbi:MAG: hypothetical protein PHS67_01680 [Sphaerochaetaceae bacterium]|jgi:hypothetical protein|nr:hypothetical protein [Sphaerochaetaceae bacterium]MDY0372071.1 hypothetical protein [Sphaerochaetaceae bacterium]